MLFLLFQLRTLGCKILAIYNIGIFKILYFFQYFQLTTGQLIFYDLGVLRMLNAIGFSYFTYIFLPARKAAIKFFYIRRIDKQVVGFIIVLIIEHVVLRSALLLICIMNSPWVDSYFLYSNQSVVVEIK